jgi:ankyrin repeat protein
MVAAQGGHLEVVKLLLAKGANPAAKYQGMTALMFAENGGHHEVVELLRTADTK